MNAWSGVALALVSAFTWGTADFVGGVATRRGHPFQVLLINASSGIVLLGALALIVGEAMPSSSAVAWAASAGAAGALGIVALYRGLAMGSAAIVAPTAGVLTAALPVVFSIAVNGWPGAVQLAGFVLAAMGIWLVARGQAADRSRTTGLRAAVLAGLGFGLFLIFIAQVPSTLVFGPLAVARGATLVIAVVLLWIGRAGVPPMSLLPLALGAGVLDAGGNVLYLLARQHVRLDVAAVLSSFYPVATVVLARVIQKERVMGWQWLGAVACLAAVGLITR